MKLLPLHIIASLLHRFIALSLHRFIASSLYCFIARFIALSLHRFIASSLHCFIASSLHRFIASSLLLPSFECNQGNVKSECRSFYSFAVNDQPKKGNNIQHWVDKILDKCLTKRIVVGW
jgi:hypothetical protein